MAGTGRPYKLQMKRSSALVGHWTASGLPAGIVMSRSGVLSGTTSESGTYAVTVRYTDFVPRTVARTLTLSVR